MTDVEQRLTEALDDVARTIAPTPPAWPVVAAAKHNERRVTRLLSTATVALIALVAGGVVIVADRHADPATVGSESRTASALLSPQRPLDPAQLSEVASILGKRLEALHQTSFAVSVAGRQVLIKGSPGTLFEAERLARIRGDLTFRQALAERTASSGRVRNANEPAASASRAGLRAPFNGLICDALTVAHTWWPTQPRTDYVTGCDTTVGIAFLMGPAAASNVQVRSARAVRVNSSWQVNVAFDRSFDPRWLRFTRRIHRADPHPSTAVGRTPCRAGQGCNTLAIDEDGVVVAHQSISGDGIADGQIEVLGSLNKDRAETLAAVLQAPPLPTTFTSR